jgi:hypothetical protein
MRALYQVAQGQPVCKICKEGVKGILGYLGPEDDLFGEVVCGVMPSFVVGCCF